DVVPIKARQNSLLSLMAALQDEEGLQQSLSDMIKAFGDKQDDKKVLNGWAPFGEGYQPVADAFWLTELGKPKPLHQGAAGAKDADLNAQRDAQLADKAVKAAVVKYKVRDLIDSDFAETLLSLLGHIRML